MNGKSMAAVVAAVAAVAALGMRGVARADDGGIAGAPEIAGAQRLYVDPQEDSKYLGKRYQKKSEGFSLTPPAGSRIVERSGIDLVSYIVDAKSWGGSLEMVPLPKGTMKLAEFADTAIDGLKKGQSFKGVQVVERKAMEVAGHPAERITLKMEGELGSGLTTGMAEGVAKQMGTKQSVNPANASVSLLCQELILAPKANANGEASRFLVLTLFTPLKDQAVATRTFDAMLASFELYDPAQLHAELLAATKLGKEWMAQRSAEEFKTKLDGNSQMYRILVNNQDLGYVEFDEGTREQDDKKQWVDVQRGGRKGVLFAATVRTFPSDGKVVSIFARNEAFWAFGRVEAGGVLGHFSLWDNLQKTRESERLPSKQVRPGGPAFQITDLWQRETGTITQDAPLPGKPDAPFIETVSYSGDSRELLPSDVSQPIPVDAEAPLPSVLQYTWPRFVDLSQPAEMTFAAFNSNTHRMDLRTLIVTGRKQDVQIDGRVVSCYKCVDEVDPNDTTMYVDSAGRIQMMVTSDQTVMIPTTAEAMETKWQSRLKDQ